MSKVVAALGRISDGWSASPYDPHTLLRVFETLWLKAGFALHAYVFREGSNGNGIIWRPTLAGWDWIPTGFRTRFRRSHHVILSPLTGLSRHTRCCMKDLLRVGRFGSPFSSPKEPHCRGAVEGSSHV